jgi:hypothetical protein
MSSPSPPPSHFLLKSITGGGDQRDCMCEEGASVSQESGSKKFIWHIKVRPKISSSRFFIKYLHCFSHLLHLLIVKAARFYDARPRVCFNPALFTRGQ